MCLCKCAYIYVRLYVCVWLKREEIKKGNKETKVVDIFQEIQFNFLNSRKAIRDFRKTLIPLLKLRSDAALPRAPEDEKREGFLVTLSLRSEFEWSMWPWRAGAIDATFTQIKRCKFVLSKYLLISSVLIPWWFSGLDRVSRQILCERTTYRIDTRRTLPAAHFTHIQTFIGYVQTKKKKERKRTHTQAVLEQMNIWTPIRKMLKHRPGKETVPPAQHHGFSPEVAVFRCQI